jgi:hypothetical protein
MATIVNDRDVLLQAASVRLEAATMPSNWSTAWSQVTGTGKPADNADVTTTVVNGGMVITSGGLTLSSGGSIKGGKTTYGSGSGFFLGYVSSSYRFDIGDSTHYLRWDGSSMSFQGNITGTGNIIITGQAKFDGTTSALGFTWALVANSSLSSAGGLLAYGTSTQPGVLANEGGITGINSTGGAGVSGLGGGGSSGGRHGVSGSTSSVNAFGGYFDNIAGGPSIYCGTSLRWGSYTYAAPSGSTTSFMRNDGTWSSLSSALVLVTSGAAPGAAATGSIVINTYGGAGQVRLATYAV